jgi:hypothetical protein
MNKYFIPLLVLLLAPILQNCQDRELFTRQRYHLQQVIIEKKLNLKEEQYTLSLNFTAQRTGSAYAIELAYPELITENGTSAADVTSVIRLLYGFSLELYDNSNGELLHSFIVTAENPPHAEKLIAALSLGDHIPLVKDKTYELRLTLPGKIDTDKNIPQPVLVMGIPSAE